MLKIFRSFQGSESYSLSTFQQVKNGFIHTEGKGPRQPENGQEKHHITFYHDNLKYEGQIVYETISRDYKTLLYYKFKMPNNGMRHNRAIEGDKRLQDSSKQNNVMGYRRHGEEGWISLAQSNKNQVIHHEFRVFDRQWFGYNILPDDGRQQGSINEHYFYHAGLNRVAQAKLIKSSCL
jgi:hypothetical protein